MYIKKCGAFLISSPCFFIDMSFSTSAFILNLFEYFSYGKLHFMATMATIRVNTHVLYSDLQSLVGFCVLLCIGVYSNTKFYFFPPSENSLKKFPPFLSKICKILGKNCQNLHNFLEKMSKFEQIWGKIAKICTILGKK